MEYVTVSEKVTYEAPRRWYFVRSGVFDSKVRVESALFWGHDHQTLYKKTQTFPRKSTWREWFPSLEEALADHAANITSNIKCREERDLPRLRKALAAVQAMQKESTQ